MRRLAGTAALCAVPTLFSPLCIREIQGRKIMAVDGEEFVMLSKPYVLLRLQYDKSSRRWRETGRWREI